MNLLKRTFCGLSLILALALAIGAVEMGCTTTSQANAYKTIAAAEQAATTAYDGYALLVAKGAVGTNSYPQISKAFNAFQTSAQLAATISMAGTNALSPAALTTELDQLLSLVAAVQTK